MLLVLVEVRFDLAAELAVGLVHVAGHVLVEEPVAAPAFLVRLAMLVRGRRLGLPSRASRPAAWLEPSRQAAFVQALKAFDLAHLASVAFDPGPAPACVPVRLVPVSVVVVVVVVHCLELVVQAVLLDVVLAVLAPEPVALEESHPALVLRPVPSGHCPVQVGPFPALEAEMVLPLAVQVLVVVVLVPLGSGDLAMAALVRLRLPQSLESVAAAPLLLLLRPVLVAVAH